MNTYFRTLTFSAVLLLWGISIWNGTIKALLLTVWHQRFEDGVIMHTQYTGIIILDFPLSILVAFFFSSTNNSNREQQMFTLDAFATFQPAYVWLYAESIRGTKQPHTLGNPIVWGILWQIFGGAVLLPIYYSRHLQWASEQPDVLAPSDVSSSRAIPVSFIIGVVLPTIMAMLPTWSHTSLDPVAHQKILAIWQLTPLWMSLTQAVITWALSQCADRMPSMSLRKKVIDNRIAAWWIQVSYLLAAVLSFLGHLHALTPVVLSSDPVNGVQRAYLPSFFTALLESPNILSSGPWMFLQFDVMIIALSSISWAYILLSRLLARRSGNLCDSKLAQFSPLLFTLFLLGVSILGPGTTVCLALFWREGELLSLRSAASISSIKDKSMKMR
ncbi:uncharacterized protein EAE98_010950 [Botrytis deweyae]|uniref:Uncharacterized protein n=1 Tax=Botrytis deweyae TaxID=2478750 RepID=A0ABQ7I7K2_9HELO|nr:uncharacterized protein EAE98_010950 [Botrytis deweyae]KAF7915870.1 hypothetical protein EAE98_010950 [Botrytis deweyae]